MKTKCDFLSNQNFDFSINKSKNYAKIKKFEIPADIKNEAETKERDRER